MSFTYSKISPMTFVNLTSAVGPPASGGRSAGYERLIGAGYELSPISSSLHSQTDKFKSWHRTSI
jgi:hypothetical protein